jgi:hypothetical protein
MITGFIASCLGTGIRTRYYRKDRRDEGEDVSSYWMTLRKREDTAT